MIESRAMGSMGANCYLYACEESKKAAIIDPGADGKRIYRWVLEKGLKVDYILLTHGHVDHIGAVDELKELLGDVLVGFMGMMQECLQMERETSLVSLARDLYFKRRMSCLKTGKNLPLVKNDLRLSQRQDTHLEAFVFYALKACLVGIRFLLGRLVELISQEDR